MTAVAVGLLRIATRSLHTSSDLATDPAGFGAVLTFLATIVAAACAVRFWCTTTSVLWGAVRGAPSPDVRGAGTARRLVLMACGLAVAAGVTPAHADDRATVAGLPPEPFAVAATPQAFPAMAAAARQTHTLVVHEGDSLWSLSADGQADAGRPTTDRAVDHAWRALWHANRAAVPDPDHIEPGQRLVVPKELR